MFILNNLIIIKIYLFNDLKFNFMFFIVYKIMLFYFLCIIVQ